MFKKTVTEAASQLLSAVELEVHLALDLLLTDERVLAAGFVNDRLWKCLTTAVENAQGKQKSGISAAKADIRRALLTEVNAVSLALVQRAKFGFDALKSVPVEFLINTANRGGRARLESFDFEEFPFIRFHGEALGAALKLREQPDQIQMDALRFAQSRWELEGFELADGDPDPQFHAAEPEVIQKRKMVRALYDASKKRLPLPVQENLNDFYGAIEYGSVYPYAVPIGVPVPLSQDDLRFVAEAYRGIGGTLRIPFQLRFAGADDAQEKALVARLQYESAGAGLQILSAWMIALDVIDEVRHCSICYRHASAISRCSVHATKTHETDVARLGKKVRPGYQQKVLAYSRVAPIRELCRKGLSWTNEAADEMRRAADLTGLSFAARRRALVLASQLRELLIVMNADIQAEAQRLFGAILAVTVLIEMQPEPIGDREKRSRERQRLALKELLSIKGFFRAWCGIGRYSPEIDLAMLGFDRNNPVVLGKSIAATQAPRMMVKQRAWEESALDFATKNQVSARNINSILRQGRSKADAALELGIALSTVYKVLKRGEKTRKRQFLA